MKVFISWSGTASKRMGEALRGWLPVVLPYVKPWFSEHDIDKGSRWSEELRKELRETQFCIACITPSNVTSQWLNFEVGAVSNSGKGISIFPLLGGLEANELDGPLSQFQITVSSRQDLLRLALSLNGLAGTDALAKDEVERNFFVCWPGFEACLVEWSSLIRDTPAQTTKALASTPQADTLSAGQVEVLKFLADAPQRHVYPEQLASGLGIHRQRARHLMEKLEEIGLLDHALNLARGPSWMLNSSGREVLIGRNLI
jgi:TIR domain